MSAEDLTLKISTSVDSASMSVVSRKVKELTSDIEKLAKSTQAFASALQGAGGVSNRPSTSGGSSAASQIASSQGARGGGLADNLTKAVTNSASLFKGAADSSKGAFRMMNDALKDHVDRSDKEVKRLERSLDGLKDKYDKVKQRQISVGGTADIGPGSALGTMHDEYINGTAQLYAARKHRQAVGQQQSQLMADALGMGPPEAPGAGGGGKGGGIIGGIMQMARGGGMGGFGAMAGGVGALAGGAAALFTGLEYGLHLRTQNQQANLNFQLAQPNFGLQRQASFGQNLGGLAASLKGGDAARALATINYARSGGASKTFTKEYFEFAKQKILKENPEGVIDNLAIGDMGGALQAGKEYAGQAAEKIARMITDGAEIPGLNNERGQKLRQQTAKEFEATLGPDQLSKGIDLVYQSNPLLNERVNSVYSGAIGTLGMARATGRSGGLITKRAADGSYYKVDQMADFNSQSLAQGYDPSTRAAMIQRMQGAAGRGAMNKNTFGMLSMEAGGLGNAPELFGVGSQFGSGGRFIGGLQGLVGRGGLDTVAATQLFGAGAGAMTSGAFDGGQGLGFMSTLAEAGYTGTPGGDLKGARQVTAGLGAMGAVMSGSVDPLQQALNASAAIQAAPNSDYTTHKGLMSLDPATALEVLRTGIIPQRLADRGITMDMIRNYAKVQGSTLFSRYAPKMGATTNIGKEIAKFQKAGGIGYLKGDKDLNHKLNMLSEGLMDTDGFTLEQSRGFIRLQAAAAGLLPGMNGKGSHRSDSLKTMHGAAAGAQGEMEETQAEALGQDVDLITGAVKATPGMARRADKARRGIQTLGGNANVDASIDMVSKALSMFVESIRNVAGQGNPTKATPR